MNDADRDTRMRDREIARNESVRQTIGDIRVSTWAIAVAVIIGLAAVGLVLLYNSVPPSRREMQDCPVMPQRPDGWMRTAEITRN